jgi:hypothetical protein
MHSPASKTVPGRARPNPAASAAPLTTLRAEEAGDDLSGVG